MAINWSKVAEIGIKITTAVIAAAAVFVGIGRAYKRHEETQKEESSQPKQETVSSEEPQSNTNTENRNQNNNDKKVNVADGLRGASDTFNRVGAFIQSLASVAESIGFLFGKGGTAGYSQPYYNDPWHYQQPMNMGGQTWNRVSPFIIDTGNPYGNYGCYGQRPFGY